MASRRAFLDANVLRGQLTTDVMLTVADARLYRPLWSEQVLDEVKRNRPPGLAPERVDASFVPMNKAFPEAMVSDYAQLMPGMQADEKDRHVLAAAVRSKSHVLVTENVKDFDPPTRGKNAMRIERISEFLNSLLDEEPELVIEAMNKMVDRNRREPRTMPELIDKMASQQDLKDFVHKLNEAVPPEQRGTDASRQTSQSARVALDGVVPLSGAVTGPTAAPEARKATQPQGTSTDKEL